MDNKSQMTILEFSIMTGITRDSLRFYDKIGLLSPESRGANGYRYYSDRQIDLAFLILDLRALGVGLEEIRRYADQRSPQRMLEFFDKQDAHIEAEIAHLRSVQELLHLRTNMAQEALARKKDVIYLEEREREPIFLCPLPANGASEIDKLTMPYDYAAAHGINISFPFCAVITQKNLMAASWSNVSRYYFKVRKNHNAWKSAGTYAVFYHQLNEDPPEDFYKPLRDFIQENGLQMEGDAYAEYALDELSTHDWTQYMLRVEIRVTPR